MKITLPYVPFLFPAAAFALPALAAMALPALAAMAQGIHVPQPGDPDEIKFSRRMAPPHMVDIEAGYALVGTKTEKLRELLDGKWGNKVKMDLASQNPGERVRVEAFQISAIEVTNRQYAEFVNARGYPPPMGWAGKDETDKRKTVIDIAREQHDLQQDLKKKADEKHKIQPFEEVSWWRANYKTQPWGIPAGEEDFPVVFVSLKDMTAFNDWAGLRGLSEAEWIRAARGESEQEYLSGDKFDVNESLNVETSGTNPTLKPVTSVAEAKTANGIFDLAGSVYEWTTSPYAELKGYKPLKSGEAKGEPEEINPKFDGNERVLKGGSFRVENPRFSTRVAHRVKAPNAAVSPMLGFRLVRTPILGFDRMSTVLNREVDSTMLDGSMNPNRTIGTEAWICEEIGGLKNLEGYSIIKKPEFLLFAPRAETKDLTIAKLHAASQKEPVTLGVFTTTEPLTHPALLPGSYVVKYRGAGKLVDKSKAKGPEKAAEANGGEKPADEKPADEKADAEKADAEKNSDKGKNEPPKKRLSKKEKELLEQEEAKQKADAAAAAKAAEEAKKKAEAEREKEIAAGNVPSWSDKPKEQQDIRLAEDVAWDPMKENLLFYDVITGAVAAKIEASSCPFEFTKVKSDDEVRHVMEEVPADPKTNHAAVRRFHVVIPTSAVKTFLSFHFDVNARDAK